MIISARDMNTYIVWIAVEDRNLTSSFLPDFYQNFRCVLPLDASSATAWHESFDFLERGVIEIAVDRVLSGRMRRRQTRRRVGEACWPEGQRSMLRSRHLHRPHGRRCASGNFLVWKVVPSNSRPPKLFSSAAATAFSETLNLSAEMSARRCEESARFWAVCALLYQYLLGFEL